MTTWRRTTIILMVGVIFLYTAGAFGKAYPAGTVLRFKIVAAPEDVEFARKYLKKYFEDEKPTAWDQAIQDGEIKIARADLDDDGIPEILIMVESSAWCGSIGCRGLLLQNRQGRWVLVDKPYISEEATIVMPEKRFGYHKLYTGDCIYTFRNGETYEILDLEDGSIIGW